MKKELKINKFHYTVLLLTSWRYEICSADKEISLFYRTQW